MERFSRRGKLFGLIGGGADLFLSPPEVEIAKMEIIRCYVTSDKLLERFQINEDGAGSLKLSHSLTDFNVQAFIISALERHGHPTIDVVT